MDSLCLQIIIASNQKHNKAITVVQHCYDDAREILHRQGLNLIMPAENFTHAYQNLARLQYIVPVRGTVSWFYNSCNAKHHALYKDVCVQQFYNKFSVKTHSQDFSLPINSQRTLQVQNSGSISGLGGPFMLS